MNVVIDKNLIPTEAKNLGVDASYTEYDYELVTSSTSPGAFTLGNRAEWIFGRYSNSVYDTNELYLDCEATIKLDNGTQSQFLHAFTNTAPEQFFTSSLFKKLEVTYGGTVIRGFESSDQLFPYVQAIYTLVNNEKTNISGIAELKSSIRPATNDVDDIKTSIASIIRNEFIYKDANDPFDICLDPSIPTLDVIADSKETFLFPYQTQNDKYYYDGSDFIGQNYLYRNCLITSKRSTALDNPGLETKIRFLVKLKHGWLNSPYKKPSSLELKIALTRADSVYGSFTGSEQLDNELNNDVLNVPILPWKFTFTKMDMYCKKLVMNEAQLQFYRQVPSLTYDFPFYFAQSISLTATSSVNVQINTSMSPQVLWVSIVPNASLRPSTSQENIRWVSSFSSSRVSDIHFRNLYINTPFGQIPKNKGYEYYKETNVNGQNSIEPRAYHDFLKTVKDPNTSLDYQTWRTNMRIYGFSINPSEANNWTEKTLASRSTINLVAQLDGLDPNQFINHSIVVIGLSWTQAIVNGFTSVTVIV